MSESLPTAAPIAAEAIDRLTEQLEMMNARMQRWDQLQEMLESTLAIGVDTLDERARGIEADLRLRGLMTLAERLTKPETLAVLTSLVERSDQLGRLAELADAAPDLIAIAVDTFDEWALKCRAEGVDLMAAARRSLHAALWLGERIREEELERLGVLLRSDLMDPRALQVVGNAATALAESQQSAASAEQPPQAGLFAGLRALGDPETRRSLAFLLQFARSFGARVGKPCSGASPSPEKP